MSDDQRDSATQPTDDEMDAEFIPNPRLYGHETQASLHAEMREEEAAGKNMGEIIARMKERGLPRPEASTGAKAATASSAQAERTSGFEAMVRDRKSSTYGMADADGDYRSWSELSPAGKLNALTRDAVYSHAPFEAFSKVVRETLPPDAVLDACLGVVLDKQNELAAIAYLLPGGGGTEPTPLVDQVQQLLLDYEDARNMSRESQLPTPTRTASEEPKRVDWRAADMRGANLAGMDLEGVDFRAADLRGVNFSNSMLRNADFRGALLDGANFQNANLYGAKMQGVEAGQADFRGADLRCVNFGGAYLLGAMMPVPSADQEAFRRVLEGKTEAAEPAKDKQPDRTNGR